MTADIELMRQLACGSEGTFRMLHDRNAPAMLDFVTAKIRWTHELEDAKIIFHDAFLILWNNRDNISIKTSFTGYLYTILYHEMLRFLR